MKKEPKGAEKRLKAGKVRGMIRVVLPKGSGGTIEKRIANLDTIRFLNKASNSVNLGRASPGTSETSRAKGRTEENYIFSRRTT